jgi:hypothetical protein
VTAAAEHRGRGEAAWRTPARLDAPVMRSVWAAAAAPLQLLGFVVLGGLVLGDRHLPGAPHGVQALVLLVPIWAVLVAPAVVGVRAGVLAVRARCRLAAIPVVVNSGVIVAITVAAGVLAG